MIAPTFFDSLFVKWRLNQEESGEAILICFDNLTDAFLTLDARGKANLAKALFHSKYKTASLTTLSALWSIYQRVGFPDLFAACFKSQVSLIRCEDIQLASLVIAILSPEAIRIILRDWASEIGAPIMSLRRRLIVSGYRDLAQMLLELLSANITLEREQILARLLKVPSSPVLRTEDKIGFIGSFTEDQLADLLLSDTDNLNTIITDRRLAEASPIAWWKIVRSADLTGISDVVCSIGLDLPNPDISLLLQFKPDPKLVSNLLRSDPADPKLLLEYLAESHVIVDPDLVAPYVYAEGTKLSALKLILASGQRPKPLADQPAVVVDLSQYIPPTQIEAVLERKPDLNLVQFHLPWGALIASRLVQRAQCPSGWYEEHRLTILHGLVEAGLYAHCFYHIDEAAEKADVLPVLQWAVNTDQLDVAQYLADVFSLPIPQVRPYSAEALAQMYDPLALICEEPYPIFTEPANDSCNVSLSGHLGCLWEEKWFKLLAKMRAKPSVALQAEAKALFQSTFADRTRNKTPHEQRLTADLAVAIHQAINSPNHPVLDKLSKLLSKPRRLRLSDVWPDYTSMDLTIDGLRVVTIDNWMLALPSKTCAKRITCQMEDGTTKSYLLKSGNLSLEATVNLLLVRMARICSVRYDGIRIHPGLGLIDWIEGAQSLRQLTESLDLSVAAYRQSGSDFCQFSKRVPRDFLLAHLYATSKPRQVIEYQMAKQLGFLCAAQFILGLGDRHLDNILLHGDQLIHIDLGLCFGQGQKLAVPEVVPFRLTKLLLGLVGPFTATLKASIASCLSILRSHANDILSTLESDEDLIREMEARLNLCFEGTQHSNAADLAEALFQAATDPSRLARMYDGWQPWL